MTHFTNLIHNPEFGFRRRWQQAHELTIPPIEMTNGQHLVQIRNSVYLLCVIAVVSLIVSVGLTIHLTNRSLEEMKALAAEGSSEQALINELNKMLESNELDALISRCKREIGEKPLSRSGHYYLGLAYYHSGDQPKSRQHLLEALRIDPAWKNAIDPFLENHQADQTGGGQPATRPGSR